MAIINETGTIHYMSKVETGTSKAGNEWQKQTIVLSCQGKSSTYNIALSVFGDKVNDCKEFKVGAMVKVGFFINAREYNGKWYNDVSLFSIEYADRPAQASQTQNIPVEELDPKDDDLPFA